MTYKLTLIVMKMTLSTHRFKFGTMAACTIYLLNKGPVKVSSHSRKFEFKVFSIVHLNDHNF